ncbi:hypothetical protein BOW53_13570 [Solemya pervernicosa gill symbiont]|uniref:Flagellar basal-body/hook protein C-terminal domain-containing protein n=2 Tax=Gammaproteobacteria incertae sedis TaxID=118884 RepID=A0A1T2L1N6_9GAMM|nr:flagellar basal body rod C-terminal domain-containing protein [Candidatus Reidiella endopervernicosa]OOZ38930.1 hypothetical protein BOW53_13570 [Solemya pervernicosa gill symbiont]QKQ26838.1 hypothetical protein HUE57_11495 [Candidatus Reidiella endopervernicosa]
MDSISNSLSGMKVAQERMRNSSNNIANVATEGFTPSRVESVQSAGGGVEVGAVTPSTAPVASGAPSGTNLAEEMAGLLQAKNSYQANAKALSIGVETYQSVEDMLTRNR